MANIGLPDAGEVLSAFTQGTSHKSFGGKSLVNDYGARASQYSSATQFLVGEVPNMVKGYGMVGDGNVKPLTNRKKIDKRSELAIATMRQIEKAGRTKPEEVLSNLSSKAFGHVLQTALSMDSMYQMRSAIAEMEKFTGKSFTLTSPLSSGFVPFDLLPLVRLIYPVYTPFRNKIPRVPGQGTSHRAKILSSISGALPGGLGTIQRDSIGELPSGGGVGPSNWPNQLPPSGSQTAYDLNVPYRFFGLTEAVTWLAQFGGQGFDDVYGVASLVLLQEFMLLEERDNIAATSQNLAAPALPTVTARTAGSNETALSGVSTNIYVKVTALNYWGETSVVTGAVTTAIASGDVADVTIPPVEAGIAYNIYVGTGSTAPSSNAGYFLMASAVGGKRYTLQGALPTTTANPPAADTGTGSSNDPEGIITQLSGKSASNGVYPTEAQAGYYNASVGDTLNVDSVATALEAMWDGVNGFLADPREIACEGTDAANLAASVRDASSGQNYLLQVQQSQVGGVIAGVAVGEIQNPITRSTVEVLVHPYYPQGTASLMSYTLPQPQNNVSNVIETVMVQDYVSIGWPVIDVTFRQSIFRYGAQAMIYAPQYMGLLQGIQKSATTPYS